MGNTSRRRWRKSQRIQTRFTPELVLANDDSSGVMLGLEALDGFESRRARALVVEVDGTYQFTLDEPGWLVTGGRQGQRVVAVLATFGPVFSLIESSDCGRTWSSPLPSSGLSIRRAAIVDADTWAMGTRTLGRWRGGVWESIEPPVQLNSINDRIFGFGAVPVLSTATGLYLWSEEHQRWGHRPIGDTYIKCVDFPYYVSQTSEKSIGIGKFIDGEISHVGAVQYPSRLHYFSCGSWPNSENQALQMVVTPESRRGAVVLIRSARAGGFTMKSVSIPGPDWVGISGHEGLLAMSVDRRIIQYR